MIELLGDLLRSVVVYSVSSLDPGCRFCFDSFCVAVDFGFACFGWDLVMHYNNLF